MDEKQVRYKSKHGSLKMCVMQICVEDLLFACDLINTTPNATEVLSLWLCISVYPKSFLPSCRQPFLKSSLLHDPFWILHLPGTHSHLTDIENVVAQSQSFLVFHHCLISIVYDGTVCNCLAIRQCCKTLRYSAIRTLFVSPLPHTFIYQIIQLYKHFNFSFI